MVRARSEAGAIDIVIGTELVTKGYHFPNLTLVGVVDADLRPPGRRFARGGASFQQFRGRRPAAGRGDKPGRVFVQTHDPEAPVIAALVDGDIAGFYAGRDRRRRAGSNAAVGRLAAIVVLRRRIRRKPKVSRGASAMLHPTSRHGRLWPRPAPLAMLRAASAATAGSRPPQPRRAGCDPDWLADIDWGAKVVSASTSIPITSKKCAKSLIIRIRRSATMLSLIFDVDSNLGAFLVMFLYWFSSICTSPTTQATNQAPPVTSARTTPQGRMRTRAEPPA